MIGLGAMGSALARAFVKADHAVTVWNRTLSKTEPLVALGATAAKSLTEAFGASPIVVLCVDNYEISRLLINGADLSELSGRTLVQLSTGTPLEARNFTDWLSGHNVNVLDGAIMPYPDGIGKEDAQILFAGFSGLYENCKPYLDCLGGDLRHVGEEISSAAVLDMALLTHQLSNYLGVWHGARACEIEGVGLDIFASMFPQDNPAAHLAWRIHRKEFEDPGASLDVWNAALDGIVQHARDTGINSEIPDLISSLFRRAIALGHGSRDLAAVMDVLRSPQ